ncbi:hypothetical protein ACO0K9_20270 [Undibacterium sp. Ji50W]|uniref:LpxL/LpxP family acyltransferase n=1 Tax=Undibacterium sp. Ji50W TaxID=3413041 RepID=UPI003BF2DF50
MKKLLPNIQVSKTVESGFIINASGKYFSVTEETVTLVEMMARVSNINQLAQKLSAHFEYEISAVDVANAIDALPNAFFEADANVATKYVYSFPIIWGSLLNFLARTFSVLFNPYVSLTIICAFAYLFLAKKAPINVENVYSVATPFLILASILFHEVGHAAACHSVKAKPGLIGFGIKGGFPTFYTDVSDVWTRGRKERMIVDSAGIYFQLIFAGILILFVPAFPSISTAVNVIIFLALFSCLPIYKFDGYWLLGDWLKANSLDLWLQNASDEILKQLRQKKFRSIDFKKAFGVLTYAAFFISIHIWFVTVSYNLISSYTNISLVNIHSLSFENFTIDNVFSLETVIKFIPLVLLAILITPAIMLAIRVLKKLLGDRLVAKINDTKILISAFLKLTLIHLLSPFFGGIKKNRIYLTELQAAFLGVNPQFKNIKSLARRTLISKYTEHLWYLILGQVSVPTGLWLVSNTHNTKTARTLEDIKNTAGPIVLAAPHFGSFITGAIMLLSKIGAERQVHLFYADPKIDKANSEYEGFYRRYFPNLSVCFNNKRGIIHAANALRRGEILVIMPDVFHGKNLLPIQVLGRNVNVMPGIAYFHRKFDAKIIPVLSTFKFFFKVDIHVGNELISPQVLANDSDDYISIMSSLFVYFEKWFRTRPQEWLCWDQFFELSTKIETNQ